MSDPSIPSEMQAAVLAAAQQAKQRGVKGLDASTVIALVSGIGGVVGTTLHAFYTRMKEREIQEEMQNMQLEFEARQRKAQRFENINELMLSYKKPLLLSAFDLQARFANQVKAGFLYDFVHKRGDQPRDGNYALYNTAYVIAEFFAWLEVIRQEVTFITGDSNAEDLNNLFDAIKFQFTGQTPVQGMGGADSEERAELLQMYAGELRAIGEVMLVPGSQDGGGLAPMGYAQFLKMLTARPPPEGADTEALKAWSTSAEHQLQTNMDLVLKHVRALADLEQPPRKRMAIIQVLLCKLIDLLDSGRPYQDPGQPPYDDGDEPQYLKRDFRMVPLVGLLSADQLAYLRKLEVFKTTNDPEIRFPGFASHLPPTMPQYERNRILGWQNACPPLQPRFRVAHGKPPKPRPYYVTGPAAVAKSFTDAFQRSFHRPGQQQASRPGDEEEGEKGPLIKSQAEHVKGGPPGPGVVVLCGDARLQQQGLPDLPGQPSGNQVLPV
ncbi:hypothetical protein WJX72_006808 [[Myrmecia] bisecta]|uniref:Uncharacterized protein n=1 Tax=[Myrmecia] bisecta TaxID=41462 RepID=A0AAW1PB01_9CHLO